MKAGDYIVSENPDIQDLISYPLQIVLFYNIRDWGGKVLLQLTLSKSWQKMYEVLNCYWTWAKSRRQKVFQTGFVSKGENCGT